ncbi:hypothetical protein L596_017612 [Steinernema carpocapsae]|uniref:Uncharacterized protein n=1 Tax=Steinernema carpocapsae TaxID=34508 RepID=A0A4U5N2L6_STECR|nr:hypothetical protein L596_017612 [Steinernema carpocapsae]
MMSVFRLDTLGLRRRFSAIAHHLPVLNCLPFNDNDSVSFATRNRGCLEEICRFLCEHGVCRVGPAIRFSRISIFDALTAIAAAATFAACLKAPHHIRSCYLGLISRPSKRCRYCTSGQQKTKRKLHN